MIAVCELQCKGISHEKVNSGFIYALRIAFPNQKIVFYAEKSHIYAIKSILKNDQVIIENIDFVTINFSDKLNYYSVFQTYFLLKKILKQLFKQNVNRLFLLSFNPVILNNLKKISKQKKYTDFKFTLVLHGGFEKIAPQNELQAFNLNKEELLNSDGIVRKKRYTISPKRIVAYLSYKLRCIKSNLIDWFFCFQTEQIENIYTYKKVLFAAPISNFKFVALSPHIISNARKYLDIDMLNVYCVILPTLFSNLSNDSTNEHVKFAVFGYGRPKVLREIMLELEKKEIKFDYEIKIIGMDNSGLSEFKNISCPNPGRRLTRQEMEYYALDVDMFLILYDKSQYRLSCSGSILEAISYRKPILNFENDCINYFNNLENPIGITSATISEYANHLEYIINNYKSFIPQLDLYKKNIDVLRSKYKIENFAEEIRKSFTW